MSLTLWGKCLEGEWSGEREFLVLVFLSSLHTSLIIREMQTKTALDSILPQQEWLSLTNHVRTSSVKVAEKM